MTDLWLQANRYKLFAVGALGTFMATLDGSIVNVALPTIAKDLKASVDLVSWVVLSYSLTLIALMLVFGAWVQQRGYSFGYRFGYVLFVLGSLVCALSGNIYVLIGARVLQASGSAMFAAIGPGMVTTVFPERERGKGIGLMVMMVSAGFMVGPTLGGLMLGIWPWQSIFLINVPVGLIGLVFVHRYFRALGRMNESRELRLSGAAALSVCLLAAIFAIKMVDKWSLSDYRFMFLVVMALIALSVFLRIESNPEKAMLGLSIFRNRQFTTASTAQQAHFVGLSGVLVLVPFYLERIKAMQPREVGLFLVILPVLMFILGPTVGRISDKIGYRLLTTLGTGSVALGMYLISGFKVETGIPYIVISLALLGIGAGLFGTPNSSAFMGSVREDQRSITSSVLATSRNIGMSIGVALSTALFSFFQNRHSEIVDERLRFVAGFQPVALVAIGIAIVAAVVCVTRPEPGHNKPVDTNR